MNFIFNKNILLCNGNLNFITTDEDFFYFTHEKRNQIFKYRKDMKTYELFETKRKYSKIFYSLNDDGFWAVYRQNILYRLNNFFEEIDIIRLDTNKNIFYIYTNLNYIFVVFQNYTLTIDKQNYDKTVKVETEDFYKKIIALEHTNFGATFSKVNNQYYLYILAGECCCRCIKIYKIKEHNCIGLPEFDKFLFSMCTKIYDYDLKNGINNFIILNKNIINDLNNLIFEESKILKII